MDEVFETISIIEVDGIPKPMNETMKSFLLVLFREVPYEYFNFLSRFQENENYIIDYCRDPYLIRNSQSYDAVTFRTMFCEYFYLAIKSFPFVSEYIIHFKNEISDARIRFGFYEHEDGEPSLVVLESNIYDNYVLDKKEIWNVFVANKIKRVDYYEVNLIAMMLTAGGSFPKITMSWTINPEYVKCDKPKMKDLL
jgi:hypothetical protein